MTISKSMILVMLMFVSSPVLAESLVIENLPSTEAREMFSAAREAYSDLALSPVGRASLLSAIWSRANRSSPVDIRAYLYALAIDLYNSLPVDVRPQPRKLGPDEDAYPPAMEPYKLQSFYSMRILDISRPQRLDEKVSGWNYMKKNFDPKRLSAAAESYYATEYLRDQIAQGNIAFDSPDASASLEPENIDIANPTYYKLLREYMNRRRPAIAAGVPPWEAENYLARER